jgi:hypothetical protein
MRIDTPIHPSISYAINQRGPFSSTGKNVMGDTQERNANPEMSRISPSRLHPFQKITRRNVRIRER